MTNEQRGIQRKLKVLQHAVKIGNTRKACRYFGVGHSSFYRWRGAYQKFGEAGHIYIYPSSEYSKLIASRIRTYLANFVV